MNLTLALLNDAFNKPIDNLPSGITHLIFDKYSKFNQSIDNLPDSIQELSLGVKFKRKINKLPQSLEKLVDKTEFQKFASA